MTSTKKDRKTIRLVFAGRSFFRNGESARFRHLYVQENMFNGLKSVEESHLAWSVPLGSSKRSTDVIGGIYEGEIGADSEGNVTAYNTGYWKFLGTIDDESSRVQLKAIDTTQEADHHAFQASKRAKKSDPMYEALAPIREAYRRSSYAGRRAIIAKVLLHLGV